MRALPFFLGACVVAGCAPASDQESDDGDAAVPDEYTVTGVLPDSADIDEILADLPDGAFVVVGDAGSPDVAIIQAAASPLDRIASSEFTASTATCLDCGDPTCVSFSRTLSVTLTHNSGIGGETFGISTLSASNFKSPVSTPANWTQAVGTQQAISTQGTLTTCGGFSYTFDVTGADRLLTFVSAATTSGSLAAPAGADASCQTFANTAKLGGTWKAWVSDATTSPFARFNNPTGKDYMMPNGVVVANDFTDLTDGSLDSALNRDENGNLVNLAAVWTGTQGNGKVASGSANSATCKGFTTNLATSRGVLGLTGRTGASWTINNTTTCNTNAHLMCFEQDP